jgi:hypothetical protein
MWQIERHAPKLVSIDIIGDGIPSVKNAEIPGYYMIKDDRTGDYVCEVNGYPPRKFYDFSDAVKWCTYFIERDYPERIK